MAKKFFIYDWMTNEMGLSGNALVMYAYLYEVTKHGELEYTGGHGELAAIMCTTIPTVYNTMKKLEERNFIKVEGDGRSDGIVIRLVA